jgi:hypothetical protein
MGRGAEVAQLALAGGGGEKSESHAVSVMAKSEFLLCQD